MRRDTTDWKAELMRTGRQTMRDLLDEAKKRIVLLLVCVVGLSYLMSRKLFHDIPSTPSPNDSMAACFTELKVCCACLALITLYYLIEMESKRVVKSIFLSFPPL